MTKQPRALGDGVGGGFGYHHYYYIYKVPREIERKGIKEKGKKKK
jgi:hypothetical protein